MSVVRFDETTGRLRLTRPAFESLTAIELGAGGGRTGPADELRAAGAIVDGAPHPALAAGIAAIRGPACKLQLRVQDRAGRRHLHDGWINGEAAALLLAGDEEGLCELAVCHPVFLPEAIARITALGPRPRTPRLVPLRLQQAEIDGLTSPDREVRTSAREELARVGLSPDAHDAVCSITAAPASRWELVVRWDPAPRSAGRRGLHVIDSAAGLWLLEPVGPELVAWPVTPTTVWRLLISSLPQDEELRRPRKR